MNYRKMSIEWSFFYNSIVKFALYNTNSLSSAWKRFIIIEPVKQFFKRKIAIIFLPIYLNMCFGCS